MGGLVRLAGVAPLAAQTAVTAAAVARQLEILRADSMRGRVTPSPALERTARYLAAQFQQLGLEAGMRDRNKDVWVWHYPVPGQLIVDLARSRVEFFHQVTRGGRKIVQENEFGVGRRMRADLATAAQFIGAMGPPKLVLPTWSMASFVDPLEMGSKHVVVVAGALTAASAARLPVHGAVVIYLPVATDSAVQVQVLHQLYDASDGVVVVKSDDSSQFVAARRRAAQQQIPVLDGYLRLADGPRHWPWAVEVRPETVRGFLETAGLGFDRLRTDTAVTIQDVPLAEVRLHLEADRRASPMVMAPGVAAVLKGSDSLLQRQYVVIAATMDSPTGDDPTRRAGSADREPGRDDGLPPAALVALAQALSQAGARPRRSVLFLATSGTGGGKKFWGTNAYMRAFDFPYVRVVPRTVAALDLDRLGAAPGDSVLVDGLQEVDLVPRLEWMLAQHPLELGVVARDGGTVLEPTSGQFPFVQFGIPSLSFHPGSPGTRADGASDSGKPSASLAAERTLPVLRLVAYIAKTLADADVPAQWSAEARPRLSELLGK